MSVSELTGEYTVCWDPKDRGSQEFCLAPNLALNFIIQYDFMPDDPKATVSYNHLLDLREIEETYYIPEGTKKKYSVQKLLDDFEENESSSMALNVEKRWKILDQLDALIFDKNTHEKDIHKLLEENLRILGTEYSPMSSNETLKKVVEEYLGKKFKGENGNKKSFLLKFVFLSMYILCQSVTKIF